MSDPVDHNTIRRAKAAVELLSSNHEGERQAAFAALDRLLPGRLSGLLMVALDAADRPAYKAPPPKPAPLLKEWQRTATLLLCSGHSFSERERRFLRDMACLKTEPSGPQLSWLSSLYARADKKGGPAHG